MYLLNCRFETPSAAAQEVINVYEFLRDEDNNEEATRCMTR